MTDKPRPSHTFSFACPFVVLSLSKKMQEEEIKITSQSLSRCPCRFCRPVHCDLRESAWLFKCPHSSLLFFPLLGLILRRCTLDEEGIAYWEPPTYVKCVSIDYRNIQMMVRQTDGRFKHIWGLLRGLLHYHSYKEEGKQDFHVKGR